MSLVRMCMVTISLFRVCMCMCLRARERQRRRESSIKAANENLLPILDASFHGCHTDAGQELAVTMRHSQSSEEPIYILTNRALPHAVRVERFQSLVGSCGFSQWVMENERRMQGKCIKRYLENKWHWSSNNLGRQYCPHGIWNEIDKQKAGHPGRQDEGREFYVSGSPSCIPHQGIVQGRISMDVVGLDKKLKTLLDEFLESRQTLYSFGECLTYSQEACQYSQLPNQVMSYAASACTITLELVMQDLYIESKTEKGGDQGESSKLVST